MSDTISDVMGNNIFDSVRMLEDNPDCASLPPWMLERFTLWSPLDMLRFYAGLYTVAMRDMTNQIGLLIAISVDSEGRTVTLSEAGAVEATDKPLKQLVEMPEIHLSRHMRTKIERYRRSLVEAPDGHSVDGAVAFLKELHNDLISEVTGPWFLMIPQERRALYEQREPPFGALVASRFADADNDIAAAARCIALDEWTAAVFHLMRALEKGLQSLARELHVSMSATIEYENWKNIIDQIEAAIRRMEKLPKSAAKSDELQFYSQAANNFWYFKEAWRNHVSHSRVTYDERAAMKVYNHVQGFMQELAARVTP